MNTPNETAALLRSVQQLFPGQPEEASGLLALWVTSAFMIAQGCCAAGCNKGGHLEVLDDLLRVVIQGDHLRVLTTIRQVVPSTFWHEIDLRIDHARGQRLTA